MIYSLINEPSYSGDVAFDWENMYSGTMVFQSGHEEFVLFAVDGNDVLMLEWFTGSSYGDALYCYRLTRRRSVRHTRGHHELRSVAGERGRNAEPDPEQL